jgi:cytochrome c-type biogenesis protein CcmH
MTTHARRLFAALLLTAIPAIASAAQAPAAMDSTALEAKSREVASQLRCPVCQGLSIQDSPSQLAQSMRDVIREKLAAGDTPEEVKAYFVASYGEWVLLEPPASGFNLAVYILPVLALVAGAVLVVVLARRWSAKPDDAGAVEAAPSDDPDLAAWDELVRTD